MRQKAIEYLIDILNKEGMFTNWHWNSFFLKFCDTFCDENDSIKKCRIKLQRYMKALSDSGVCECEKHPLGPGSMSTYGARTQTIWVKTIKHEININMIKTYTKPNNQNGE